MPQCWTWSERLGGEECEGTSRDDGNQVPKTQNLQRVYPPKVVCTDLNLSPTWAIVTHKKSTLGMAWARNRKFASIKNGLVVTLVRK